MTSHLETWLSTVASQLDLPAVQKDAVVEELRAHLQADFADRLSKGAAEDEAMRSALAEMGAPEPVAAQLQRVHDTEGSGLRSSLAVLIMLLGFFGSIFAREGVSLAADRLTNSPSAGWWHNWLPISLQWIVQHDLHQLLLFPLLLVGVSFIVGYVARRRGWRCALLPVVFIYGSIMVVALASGGKLNFDVAGTAALATTVLAVLVGAHLGAQLVRWKSPLRRPLFALLAGIAGLAPILGCTGLIFILHRRSFSSSLGLPILGAIVVSLAVVVVLAFLAWRRPSAPA